MAKNNVKATKKIAVLFVHGVGIDDKDTVEVPIERLKRKFDDLCGMPADDHLKIVPIVWGKELHRRETVLFERCFGPTAEKFSESMEGLVRKINKGDSSSLRAFIWRVLGLSRALKVFPDFFTGILQQKHDLNGYNYPGMRWALTQLLGDAINYEFGKEGKAYENFHNKIADALLGIEREVGESAPLCVVAHSLGTVVVSNYLYDLQKRHGQSGGVAEPGEGRQSRVGDSPLVNGSTLTFFYTLGSPLALWASAHLEDPDLGKPIEFPGRQCDRRLRKHSEWVNILDPDDVVAFPLEPVYPESPVRDWNVSVGGPIGGATPAAHLAYWYDDKVVTAIAEKLCQASKALNS